MIRIFFVGLFVGLTSLSYASYFPSTEYDDNFGGPQLKYDACHDFDLEHAILEDFCMRIQSFPWDDFEKDLFSGKMSYKKISASEQQTVQKKIRFHRENAVRCYTDAKNICWKLKDEKYRAIARECIFVIINSADPKTPNSYLMLDLLHALDRNGVSSVNNWEKIKNKLMYASYHYAELAKWTKISEEK